VGARSSLAPDIQEFLLFLDEQHRSQVLHSTLLPLAAQPCWEEQRRLWEARPLASPR
jgi:hypothetical protein